MNVLSLFDGMACGRLALERAGVKVTNYIASEIDKYAIQIAKKNWPDIKHIGSVTDLMIDYDEFYNETTISNFYTDVSYTFTGKFDLIIGGSPCQGFSFAGKGLNFEDPRSKLFFEFVRLKNRILEINEKAKFFLENVKMKAVHKAVITEYIGVEPIFHNSALVSAQTRKRFYWTNIPYIGESKDCGIVLLNILETQIPIRYMLRPTKDGRNHFDFEQHSDSEQDKSRTLVANLHKGVPYNVVIDRRKATIVGMADDIKRFDNNRRIYSVHGKGPTLISCTGGHKTPKIEKYLYLSQEEVNRGFKKHKAKIWKSGNRMGNMDFPNNVYKKAKSLSSINISGARETNHVLDEFYYRKLTPIECERLQTMPDNYTEGVSNTQRYKMLGNGWCCDSIVNFFLPLNPAYNFLF